MPKISVVLPVYNVGSYLPETLNSLAHQSYKDFEVICVNDGSTDNSLQILQEFANSDGRFKIINQKNSGVAIARNNGLKAASGEYIYFMDSDDTVHPQLLEICLNMAEQNKADLVCFDWQSSKSRILTFNPIKQSDIKYKVTENPLFLGCNRSQYFIAFNVWSKFYKRELLNGMFFIPELRNFQDYPFVYEVLSKRPKTVVMDVQLYYYFNREGNITHSKEKPERITYYHLGIDRVCKIYATEGFEKELEFIKQDFIPTILKMQLGKIRHADFTARREMYKLFTAELTELYEKGFLIRKGHKLRRYLKYRYLIFCAKTVRYFSQLKNK